MSANHRASAPRCLIGRGSAVMQRLLAQTEALRRRCCTVLVLGESGSGKELVARLIHSGSSRSAGPFVPVDCTTLRDTLFESQLFGHVKGAFTGADRPTLGFFRAAHGGTLFLDEIGELPLHIQAKLLRCIQEGAVVPLGASAAIEADVRIIAATHRDLSAMVRRGEFRQDLYYRLNVACLRVPPLRQRKEDVPELVQQALRDLAQVYDEPIKPLSPAALEALVAHDWPGNVRELLNAIEHALVFASGDAIEVEDLPESIRPAPLSALNGHHSLTFAHAERQIIASALRSSNGNQSQAAKTLGIERHRLRRRIVHHELLDLTHPRMI